MIDIGIYVAGAEVDQVGKVLGHESICENSSLDGEVWSDEGDEKRGAAGCGANGLILSRIAKSHKYFGATKEDRNLLCPLSTKPYAHIQLAPEGRIHHPLSRASILRPACRLQPVLRVESVGHRTHEYGSLA